MYNLRTFTTPKPIFWQSTLSDRTPVDRFLWGCLKARVYAGRPHTAAELKRSIHGEIAAVPVDVLNRTLHGVRSRALQCICCDCDHPKDVIVKS